MSESVDHEIIRRWVEGQSMRGIAADLGISRHRVTRAIGNHERSRDSGAPIPISPNVVAGGRASWTSSKRG